MASTNPYVSGLHYEMLQPPPSLDDSRTMSVDLHHPPRDGALSGPLRSQHMLPVPKPVQMVMSPVASGFMAGLATQDTSIMIITDSPRSGDSPHGGDSPRSPGSDPGSVVGAQFGTASEEEEDEEGDEGSLPEGGAGADSAGEGRPLLGGSGGGATRAASASDAAGAAHLGSGVLKDAVDAVGGKDVGGVGGTSRSVYACSACMCTVLSCST